MEVVLNATLAGGVAIGTSCDLITIPIVSLCIGATAGLISAYCYLSVNRFIQIKWRLHDTCGVQYLHGIPGILGGICGAICCFVVEKFF